jgi:DNA-binding CsgD family transcriptional regulator
VIDESRALSALIAEIYDAALAKDAWEGVLAKVCTFVGASGGGNFFSQQSSSRDAVLHFSWGCDPGYERSYLTEYYKLNPTVPALSFVDVGVVFSQSDLIPYDEFEDTRFYKEWVAPQGLVDVIGSNLDKSSAGSSMLALRRSQSDGRVDAECRRKLELVVPHMRRAVLIGNVIETHKNATAALSGTLMALSDAVFLVDSRARIVFSNAAGETLLRRNVIIRSIQSLLAAVDPRANRLLQDAVIATEAGDLAAKGVAVALSPAPDQWLAHVMPISASTRAQAGIPEAATAAVFVRKATVETPSALETVAKLYKLTAMEVRVLQAVVDIGGAPVAAEALGISEATVKTHLRNLYQKTDCRRQADLVKLVAGSASPFIS